MANVTLRLVKGTPLTNSEVDNNFSNLNITKTEIGGDLGGNVFTPQVTGIQGRAVSNAAPSNAQVLTWSVTSNTWLPSNAVALYSELQTKPGLNVIISGDVVGNANIVLANTNTNIITINTVFSPTSFDSRYLRLSTTGLQVVTGPVEFESNVIFSGNVTTISANNLIIEDNFIYLNNQAINANIDFGFVGNYNDGTYAHAGFFRDASDNGTWKLFDGYTPEPDANINIDTSNSTFRFANLQINTIRANTLVGISNTTVVTNLNADLLDGQHGTYYSDYTNATNRPAANVLLTGDVSGSSNVSLVAGTNIVTISTTIQANSVALGTDTVGPYVGNVITGGNVTVSVSGEEGANITISIPQAIGSNANVTFNNVTGSNAIFSPAIYGTAVYSAGSPVWTAANDGAGSGLDADTLDGLNSNYFTNYVNQNNKPSANVVISGAISGSANTLLSANTNIISISTSVNNNSVTLGTHTVGDYTARVIAGTAINVSGTGDEGNVITVTHADTSTLLGLIGTQGIANITVDTFGHVTAANTATYLTAESDTLATVTGRGATTTTAITVNTSAGANAITTTGNISVNGALVFTQNTDGAGSGLDADLLDGQQGTYYLDYNNLTNDPAANIVLTGNLLGSGNAVLTANSTVISISARVANDSVTLGTHTVGRFIANVQQGTAIEVSGGGAEDAVATVSHADTSTLSGLQGGSGISSVTVDGLGHVTAVGTATYLTTPGLNVAFTGDVTGAGNINLTNSSTNSLTIALTVQPNSVALGTDTTGNYTDRVVGGTGISVTGTADEGNVLTASLTSTGVVATTYGNARIIPVVTVDAQGRLTAASNVTFGADVANITLTGDVTGSANAILGPNSTAISISTTIQPNSVALGTDTTGNYTDRVVGGTGISVTGTADEGNVLTASLTSTGVVASTYGNARIIPVVTVDAQGRITSASNVTMGADVANIILTGDVSGSANAILGPNSTTISISTTVQPNSVALGTDTTGNYVDRVVGGTGISVTGTADEGNVLTASLTTTGVTANTYGNATIIPVFTVDAQGRITSASNIALSAIGTSTNSQILYNSNGNVVGSSGLTYDGTSIRVNGNLESIYQNGSEGGEIFLKNAASSTSIINGVTIDVFQDKLRFFENGGTNRGFYIDITTGNTSAGTNLVGSGGGGGTTDYAALTNKPAANIILTGDVSGSANAILTSGNTVLSITTTIQPNSVALGTDTTGNYVDRVVSGGNITVTGSADEGNVITISIPQAVSTTSDLQFRNLTLSGNLSLPTLANIIGSTSLTIVGTTEATSSSTGELIVQGGIGVGANLWATGNIVASTGNVIARKFTSLANSSYFVEPAAANAVIVAGNVYTNQRIGFMNVNTTVSVVYQYYNANTRSIDTVFG